jgi:hypothetical protein
LAPDAIFRTVRCLYTRKQPPSTIGARRQLFARNWCVMVSDRRAADTANRTTVCAYQRQLWQPANRASAVPNLPTTGRFAAKLLWLKNDSPDRRLETGRVLVHGRFMASNAFLQIKPGNNGDSERWGSIRTADAVMDPESFLTRIGIVLHAGARALSKARPADRKQGASCCRRATRSRMLAYPRSLLGCRAGTSVSACPLLVCAANAGCTQDVRIAWATGDG